VLCIRKQPIEGSRSGRSSCTSLGSDCGVPAASQKPTEAALINQFEQTTGGKTVETFGSVTFQQVGALFADVAAESSMLPDIQRHHTVTDIPLLSSTCPCNSPQPPSSFMHCGSVGINPQFGASQVFNISYNQIQGLPPIWMFADNVPSWAEGGIDIRVRQAHDLILPTTSSSKPDRTPCAKIIVDCRPWMSRP
jgi:hypothetical protein